VPYPYVVPMTIEKAYRKGWDASKRTRTYDLTQAEMRFDRRHGLSTYSPEGDAFTRGWIDYAAGHDFDPANKTAWQS
jgi:hypothetical protein